MGRFTSFYRLNYLHTSQNKVSKYVIKKYFIISLFPPKIDIKLAS
ncbi:hypothetical protein NT01EI_2704 [Edwardsiella ictaluri 93-146]|uniref:Uncharacterized protein n=1 Tax=Edwardsiella ictaluri (strain 93-146) TaxID=634503 RepID=C5B8L1_EDWI9|nr:hypothetical protein NT01EI_2704 [Edwardsiella ictaluri 93-146]